MKIYNEQSLTAIISDKWYYFSKKVIPSSNIEHAKPKISWFDSLKNASFWVLYNKQIIIDKKHEFDCTYIL